MIERGGFMSALLESADPLCTDSMVGCLGFDAGIWAGGNRAGGPGGCAQARGSHRGSHAGHPGAPGGFRVAAAAPRAARRTGRPYQPPCLTQMADMPAEIDLNQTRLVVLALQVVQAMSMHHQAV